MAEINIDFAAVSRVASRIELKDIRLTEVQAKSNPSVSGTLEPCFNHDCKVLSHEPNALRVACHYRFEVHVTETPVLEADTTYLLTYEIHGGEALAENDLSQFAFANGTLHTWPFAREFVHSLTSRMGYPPYTLPVFHFVSVPPDKKVVEEETKPSAELTSSE